MNYLKEEDITNLRAVETPLTILQETVKKHFPGFKSDYLYRNIYEMLFLHVVRGSNEEEDPF